MIDLEIPNPFPSPFQKDILRLWQTFNENASEETITLLNQYPAVLKSIPKVWACSPFVANICTRSPEILHDLIQSGSLFESSIEYKQQVSAYLSEVNDEQNIMRKLRLYRQREMMRIAWRDLAEWANLAETLKS